MRDPERPYPVGRLFLASQSHEQAKIAGDGGGEIRTPETGVARLPVFKTGAFNRSATPPGALQDMMLRNSTNGRLWTLVCPAAVVGCR
jgi:hypothetical protein